MAAPAGAVTKPQAIAAVRVVLKKNATACGYAVKSLTATRAGKAWRVAAVLTGAQAGTARWTVAAKPTAANALARKVASGCPAAPEPEPPQPPAPAVYNFGPEVPAAQQAALKRALDLGASYFRTVMSTELPTFQVYAHTDTEAMIATYAATQQFATADSSRQLWGSGSHVANAEYRKTWWGPSWFADQPLWNSTKIAVHELYHVLEYELAGDRALNSGFDDIPRAGPRWLSEGAAELYAYAAIDKARLRSLGDSRSQWVATTESQPSVTLERLSYLRAQSEVFRPYDIYALAVEHLTRDRGPASVVEYFTAIGRGTPWPDAFAAAFGRTIDEYYAEFETYRRTL